MRIALNKINRLPDACFSTWRLSNGDVEAHPLALVDYKALGQPGAGAPANPTGDPDAIWLSAGSRAAYNTADGRLAPGDVCEWGTGADYCNAASDVTLIIGMPDGESNLAVQAADIAAGSKDAIGALTVDTQRAGITIVNGEMIVEDKG